MTRVKTGDLPSGIRQKKNNLYSYKNKRNSFTDWKRCQTNNEAKRELKKKQIIKREKRR